MTYATLSQVDIAGPHQYHAAVGQALDAVAAAEALAGFDTIILKPNIVNGSPPPVTTDYRCVAAVAAYLSRRVKGRILVAEGSGEGDTLDNFRRLGYEEMGLPLVDLDALEQERLACPQARVFTEIHLPELLSGAGLVSIPPAKHHTITGVTLGLKNMVGCLPADRYGGYWSFKKSQVHRLGCSEAVADLMLYCRPHLTVIDASVGLSGGHLGGRPFDPPLGKIIASTDVLAADEAGCSLLGRDPAGIEHLRLAALLSGK